jgi:hypothetical protein
MSNLFIQIALGFLLGSGFFIYSQKNEFLRKLKDKFEFYLLKKVKIVENIKLVIVSVKILKNQHGYIAINSAAMRAYNSVAPPCAPPENNAQTPAKPNLNDFDCLKNLILTAYIPFYQDFENDKIELILSDKYIQNFIAEKTALAILFYDYQTLAKTDFAGFEKKIFLEISRKFNTIKSTAGKYNFDRNVIIASDCELILKKAILSYLTYFNIKLQSLDTPISKSFSDNKVQSLYDFVSDDVSLESGQDDNEYDYISETAQLSLLPPSETTVETRQIKQIKQKTHRPKKTKAQAPVQLGFDFAGGDLYV